MLAGILLGLLLAGLIFQAELFCPACLPGSIPQPKPAPRIKPALGVGPRHTGGSPPSGPTGNGGRAHRRIRRGWLFPPQVPGAKNEYEGCTTLRLLAEDKTGILQNIPRMRVYTRTCARACAFVWGKSRTCMLWLACCCGVSKAFSALGHVVLGRNDTLCRLRHQSKICKTSKSWIV
jgi:hypothetical protein